MEKTLLASGTLDEGQVISIFKREDASGFEVVEDRSFDSEIEVIRYLGWAEGYDCADLCQAAFGADAIERADRDKFIRTWHIQAECAREMIAKKVAELATLQADLRHAENLAGMYDDAPEVLEGVL